MSATPNNAGAGWPPPPSGSEQGRTCVPEGTSAGRDALQALLAFACIQEQASRHRQSKNGADKNRSLIDEDAFGLDEVLSLVAARAVSITGADGVAIALAEENAIVCRASAGHMSPDRGARLDPNSGFSGACLRSGHTVRCDDSETDPRVNAQACRELGTRSMIAVPLSAKQRIIGLIEAFSTDAYGFNETDVRSLNLLGELILAAIRPEDENRLAELAGQIVTPEPRIPALDQALATEEMLASTVATAKIIIDEKFSPAPAQKHVASAAIIERDQKKAPTDLKTLSPKADPAGGIPDSPVPKEQPSFLRIALLAVSFLVAIALGWGLVSKARHVGQAISANTRTESLSQPAPEIPEATQQLPAEPLKPGATPEVTGIRHWSSSQSSTVVVDLQDQVQYEAHSLENPFRIYFDLHDTKLGSALINQSINVEDAFVKRIRAAQPVSGITRVVLETKGECEFSVSLDPNPYRLTITVHKPIANSGVKTSPIALPKPSPAIEPKKKSAPGKALLDTSEFKIVLDAGHGGWDLGTVGRKGLLEKDLVLDIVARLGKLIGDKLGTQVIYTRQDDSYLALEKRAEIANLARADLFLSIHANYSDLTTARGIETYYTNTYSSLKARTEDDNPLLKQVDWTGVDIRTKVTDSHRLADAVQKALYGGLVVRNPELRNRGVKEAQYVVLTGTQMPAVLAEVSFVSSPADEDNLQSSEYRQEIAEALYRGVSRYCQDLRHTKLAKSLN